MRQSITSAAAIVLATAAVSVVASPDRTSTDRETSEFWAQFNIGDSSCDVYNAMGKLILVTQDENLRPTILMWDGQFFTLFVRGAEIVDLTTGEDEQGRPTFAGNYDSNDDPQLTGFVDITPDGNRIVQIYETPEVVNARYETAMDGAVVSLASCECPQAGTLICEARHCGMQTPPLCDLGDTVRCKWTYAIGEGS